MQKKYFPGYFQAQKKPPWPGRLKEVLQKNCLTKTKNQNLLLKSNRPDTRLLMHYNACLPGLLMHYNASFLPL